MKRLLLVLVAGIGDFVLATPALRSFRHGLPAARLTLLTTPEAATLARPCPHLDEVLTFDLRGHRPGERGLGLRGAREFFALAADLRARRFDLAVNLERIASWTGAVRMAVLLRLTGARRTAGRWSAGRGCFFGIRVRAEGHQMDAMAAIPRALGCPMGDAPPQLWIPGEAIRSRERLLGFAAPSSDRYIVLQLSSNKPTGRIPAEKAVAIGRALSRSTGLPLICTGQASERERLESVRQGVGAGCRNLAGQTDLLTLAALLQNAVAVVSTDSGPMHMAAALGTPLVALFGPGDPAKFGPRGDRRRIAVLEGSLWPRDPHRWHEDIRPDAVVEAVGRVTSAAREERR